MRKELKEKEGERMAFTATVEHFGTKQNYLGYSEATILLMDVRFGSTGELATEHVWFSVGTTIEKLKLKIGDKIQFEARIGAYTKGYVNRRVNINNQQTDYKLNRPTKFVRLK